MTLPGFDPQARVEALLRRDARVSAARLVGSRARGNATALSDWDFAVDTSDFDSLAADLPALVAPLQPLSWIWDPLARHATFTALLRGPLKIDLLFERAHAPCPPWRVTAKALPRIDAHFWDWALWLGSKRAAGSEHLVRAQLVEMHAHLLAPLGAESPPGDLAEAVRVYVDASRLQASELGVVLPDEPAASAGRALSV
jgi:hypothetical protein